MPADDVLQAHPSTTAPGRWLAPCKPSQGHSDHPQPRKEDRSAMPHRHVQASGPSRDAAASSPSLFPSGPHRQVVLALAVVAGALLLTEPAWAQAGGAGNITTFLQNIVNIITGTAGKLIAVIAIAIVGIAWMLGAASARTAGGVVLGVMLVFSASWLVDQIVGG